MGSPANKLSRRPKRSQPAASASDSLHAKGLSAASSGKYELAASLFVEAIQLAGPAVHYCHSLARSLQASGKYSQAAVCYKQAIGGAPGNVQLYLELARALLQDNRDTEAVNVLRHAVAVQPNAAEGWALLGGALSLTGHSGHALEALRQAIALDAGQASFHYDLALVLSQNGEVHAAEATYRHALEMNARFPEALNNLGNLLRRRNAPEEAVACFHRALLYRPEYPDATYNLGLALQDLDLLEDAETSYKAVLAKNPDHHAALNNYGNVLLGQGRVHDALARYEAASKLAPQSRDYRVNIGMAQLLNGDFRAGWRNYASRVAPTASDGLLWSGEPIDGRSILLLSEQGLGDTLQFIRYAQHIKFARGQVRALCPEPLAELLRTVPGLESVTVTGQQPPQCDWYAPLMHLPGMLDTRLESIPGQTPYLYADAERVRQWGLSLEMPDSHLKVGIAWRGGADHRNDRNRSIDPAHFAELAGLPDITYVSLQQGHRRGFDSLPFTPLQRELTCFADTAALMVHLDLVISVDTSVAHLAGALAVPVWTLLPFAPDWRWLLGRSDTPWYPGMKLFRQTQRGEWRSLLRGVREELRGTRGFSRVT
jgi:Flp pilus assembly protein TadD